MVSMNWRLHRCPCQIEWRPLALPYFCWVATGLAFASGCRNHGIDLVVPFPEGRDSLGPTVRLVTWNIHKGLDPDLRADLASLVEGERPDILLIQEGKADISPGGGLGGLFGKGWRYPWPGGKTVGVMTFSSAAPVESELLSSRHRELLVTAPKEALITRYCLQDGRSLLVANLHAICFERWGSRKFRAQLEAIGSRLAAHDGPIILAGDFNTWNRRRLEAVDRLARSLDLEEVSGFPPTRMTGDRGSRALNWICGVDPRLPLDRIYQRGLLVESQEVLDGYRSSDHLGLLTMLRLPAG